MDPLDYLVMQYPTLLVTIFGSLMHPYFLFNFCKLFNIFKIIISPLNINMSYVNICRYASVTISFDERNTAEGEVS